uniref:DNA-binding protein n=1 Tax=Elaeophora elaphi TaxID=1147741 RepID=A0A0R3RPZ0_9BILA
MMNSNKILEETKLTKETVCINNANAARYFMRNNIISNGRSAFETANLINDKLS